jgi:DUF3040 family protein
MALSPKEREDFDEIVTRLRFEDASLGTIRPRRGRFALVLCVVVAALVFGIGVALIGHGLIGPLLIAASLVGCVALAWYWRARPGPIRRPFRRP